jgi:hypothetical protein
VDEQIQTLQTLHSGAEFGLRDSHAHRNASSCIISYSLHPVAN